MSSTTTGRRVLAVLAGLVTSSAIAQDIVIQAGTLIDVASIAPLHHMSVVVQGDRIKAVQPGFVTVAGAQIVDLRTETVLPGFIDCHVHLSLLLPARSNATEYRLTHSDLDKAFDAAQFARQLLQQGFTSVRDVGGGDETVALRKAIDAGKVPGPRLSVSLEPLGPTAGHSDPRNGLDTNLTNQDWTKGIVDSPEEARYRVREHKQRGANLIKIVPSGGIASTGDDPQQQLMTNEEMQAAVQTAHALGLKVAAHAYPSTVIENAVRAGVDSIEHGSFATAQTFALMKVHGTYLVPTLSTYEIYYQVAREHPELLTPGSAAKEIANDLLPKRNLPVALRSGVAIAYGTDLGEGDHTLEFELLIGNGMQPMEAIVAATRSAATLLGSSDIVGTVQEGKFADLVAVPQDPLLHPEALRHVTFVMKGGTIYRRDGKPTAAGW